MFLVKVDSLVFSYHHENWQQLPIVKEYILKYNIIKIPGNSLSLGKENVTFCTFTTSGM